MLLLSIFFRFDIFGFKVVWSYRLHYIHGRIFFCFYLGSTCTLVLLNIPLIAWNQLSSAIVFLTSASFTIYRNGSSTKYNVTLRTYPARVPTCPWSNIFGMKTSRNEPLNSVSQTMKVILMFTSNSLRLLILDLSDSALPSFLFEVLSLKF